MAFRQADADAAACLTCLTDDAGAHMQLKLHCNEVVVRGAAQADHGEHGEHGEHGVWQTAAANSTWGPPKPRKAVLENMLVLHRCPTARTAPSLYALSARISHRVRKNGDIGQTRPMRGSAGSCCVESQPLIPRRVQGSCAGGAGRAARYQRGCPNPSCLRLRVVSSAGSVGC